MAHTPALSRRHLLQAAGGALAGSSLRPRLVAQSPAPSPVAIARCRSFGREFELALEGCLDAIGGIGDLVRGKTVAIKPNLTGSAQSVPPRREMPFRTDPDTLLAVATLIARNGAKRIRIIEGFFPVTQELEYWAAYGLDIHAINNCGCPVEWENTNHMGQGAGYARMTVPHGGYLFPAFDLNHSYRDCDVYVSLSKLKNHWLAGVTMGLKNNFGITPASLYGGDAGPGGNEAPKKYRGETLHNGTTPIAQDVPRELDPGSPREPGYRIPRIIADLCAARPIDLSIIDGIETIRGGEGPWNPGVQWVKPGVLLVGRNATGADAAGAAVMGYDPRAEQGTPPFAARSNYGGAANHLLLAEAAGLGSADLAQIEIAGLSLEEAKFDFGPGPLGQPVEVPGAELAAYSAASGTGMLAPGSIFSAWGKGIATQIRVAEARGQLDLNGVAIDVTDSAGVTRPARMLFASPGQANAVLDELLVPGPATVTLTTEDGRRLASTERIYAVAPAVFTADGSGRGVAAAYVVRQSGPDQYTDLVFACSAGPEIVSCQPAAVGLGAEGDVSVLVLFLTGMGRLSSPAGVEVRIGGQPLEILFAGAQSQYDGLDQVNVRLPRSLAGQGEVTVQVIVDGEPSNPVIISLA